MDGITEVSHAPEEREKLCSHLPVELRLAAGGEHAVSYQENFTAFCTHSMSCNTCHRLLLAHVSSAFSSVTEELVGI